MKQIMQIAIAEAEKARDLGEVPVGAVIVDRKGNILAKAYNQVENTQNPIKHAEIIAIEEALKIVEDKYLTDCDIYVTLEPCSMCASAIALARLRRLYFGAYDKKTGGTENGARIFANKNCHHRPEIYGGISERFCQDLLKEFFKNKR